MAIVETVKVYKGKAEVVCNKTDVKKWNDAGYWTSSQQKENAKKKKLSPEELKAIEEKERVEAENTAIASYIKEGLEARKKAGEPDLTEEELVKFTEFYTEEYKAKKAEGSK